MASKLTDEERESHIRYSQSDKTAVITTAIRKDILELQRKGYRVISIANEYYTFEGPKNFISFRTIEKTEVESGRKLSPEHKEKLINGRKSKTN